MPIPLDYYNHDLQIVYPEELGREPLGRSGNESVLPSGNDTYITLVITGVNVHVLSLKLFVQGADGVRITFSEDDGTLIPNDVSTISFTYASHVG